MMLPNFSNMLLYLGMQCCGSGIFFPDPESHFFPSWIRIFYIPDPHQRI
jgi:hypothetical protein